MQARIEPPTIRILSDGQDGKKMTRRKTAPPPTEMGRLAAEREGASQSLASPCLSNESATHKWTAVMIELTPHSARMLA